MNDRRTTIERAFELAATGRFRTVTEIRGALRLERYETVDSTLSGKGVRDQLRRLIASARPSPALFESTATNPSESDSA